MRWFLSLSTTAVVTVLFGMLEWVVARWQLPVVSAWVKRVLPGATGARLIDLWLVLGAQIAVYAAAYWYLGQRLRYLAQQTEAIPRDPPAWLLAGRLLFANPAPGWAWRFAVPVGIAVALVFPLVAAGLLAAAPWGLAALYAVSLAGTALRPDPSPLETPTPP